MVKITPLCGRFPPLTLIAVALLQAARPPLRRLVVAGMLRPVATPAIVGMLRRRLTVALVDAPLAADTTPIPIKRQARLSSAV